MKIPSRTGGTAGAASPSSLDRWPTGRRRAVAGLVAAGLVGSTLLLPGIAAAEPPAFPDNIVVFPDRDFVTIEGYQDHVGETATVEVTPRQQVIGSAKGVVEAGDVAFEVNHPGGFCWGAGTGLNVTPDIQAGRRRVDQLPVAATGAGDTTVADATVTGRLGARAATTLTVTGHIGAGRQPGPARAADHQAGPKDTVVARRDIRAVPGAAAPRPEGRLLVGHTLELRRRHLHRHLHLRRPGAAQIAATPASASGRCPGRSRTPTATGRA